MELKLGKKPATYDKRDLHMAAYLHEELPQTPPKTDTEIRSALHRDWGTLGNDSYGDCVFAGAGHETEWWNDHVGRVVPFSDRGVLEDYGAVTGFDPNTGANDNGTNVRDALVFRRHTGVQDEKGERHRIGAFVAIEPGHRDQVKLATYLLDAVGIGFEFPQSAMDQFNAGKPWTVVPGAQVVGGHYVCVLGYSRAWVYVITWGRVQRMSWSFFAKYCDEAWALLSEEFLKTGKSPDGFELAELENDLQHLSS